MSCQSCGASMLHANLNPDRSQDDQSAPQLRNPCARSFPGIRIAPSILSADFGWLGLQIAEIMDAGAGSFTST